MSTYEKNGHIHGSFDVIRHGKFEHVGREAVAMFWKSKDWSVFDNDIDENGEVIKNRADLRIEFNDKVILMEAATKRHDLFRYAKSGVDVETRKLKYRREGQKAFVAMCDYHLDDNRNAYFGNEMLIIPMECLELAQRDCGSEFKGMGSVGSSFRFVMPDHGCHRVRKKCEKGYRQNGMAEDFYRIPYEYIVHYRKNEEGYYQLISKPIWSAKNG